MQDAGPKTLTEIRQEAKQQQTDIERKDALSRAQNQGRGSRLDRSKAPLVSVDGISMTSIQRTQL